MLGLLLTAGVVGTVVGTVVGAVALVLLALGLVSSVSDFRKSAWYVSVLRSCSWRWVVTFFSVVVSSLRGLNPLGNIPVGCLLLPVPLVLKPQGAGTTSRLVCRHLLPSW